MGAAAVDLPEPDDERDIEAVLGQLALQYVRDAGCLVSRRRQARRRDRQRLLSTQSRGNGVRRPRLIVRER